MTESAHSHKAQRAYQVTSFRFIPTYWQDCSLSKKTAEVHQGLDSQTDVTFVERSQSVRLLGIRLSTDPLIAAEETSASILGLVGQVTNQWISRQLTPIGTVHVAKQVASKVTYPATHYSYIRAACPKACNMPQWTRERQLCDTQA